MHTQSDTLPLEIMSDTHKHMQEKQSAESKKSEIALREETVLEFWREHDIFNKSIEKDAPNGDFVFYDGPPFATGLPHYGHILAGTLKDAIPRFWTMNGYRVRRKWGWDCHGLPLENLIEKKLGLATKKDIEEYGVQNFNEQARDAVLEFADDWRRIIPRMGRFVDMEDDYKTMDPSYTESVWWVFKTLHEKGLVYEGFKGMHLCPRCGTTLSNFEVNQGYKDIKDIAVFAELPLQETLLEEGEPTTSLIVWTTTPWTLPGNMAAAVHGEYDYAVVEKKDEGVGERVRFVVAKDRLEAIFGGQEYTVVREIKGAELVGKSYEPPFPYHSNREFENKQNAWKIYHAPYVELGDEGTGAVHLAPAYGEEDMELAKVNNIPIVHHVDESGHFMDFVTDFAGQLVKPKDDDDAGVTHLDADIEVVKALKANGKLFLKENVTHSYPHCWRCDTPLLNYATTSWFVEVTKIKDQLVAENNGVNWVPDHVGKNRFGKWLENARDWAVSRQRYWGAPLPIWRNPATKAYKVFGSLLELQKYVPKSGNHYYLMRHGQTNSNIEGIINFNKNNGDVLTEKGVTQVEDAVKNLPNDIELIVHSGFERTQQTAEIVAKALSLPEDAVIEDGRFGEIHMPEVMQGKKWSEYSGQFPNWEDRYAKHIEGFENRGDVHKRVGVMIAELDKSYKDKKILLVGHGCTLLESEAIFASADISKTKEIHDTYGYFQNAEVKSFEYTPYPHNDGFLLDYHRPYIDNIELEENGIQLERVPDVFDCWFESGSMPYAETHYPFENLDVADMEKGKRFPADFISESVDQTRGWFYSLMVLGVALFGKSPYQNVITNGLVLAEDGKKMSKKLQNYPDPGELVERQGADAMRFYLLSSSIIKGEDLNFSEKEVQELQRKNIGRLHNVLAMYEQYKDDSESHTRSKHVLDRWILARLYTLISESTEGFKNYELDKATRPITDFIDDLSVWYLRRSRDRLKSVDELDRAAVLGTLRFVLQQLALVMAPSMPFYAEYLWGNVKEMKDVESVHLADWPASGEIDAELLEAMTKTREVVSLALEQRAKANLKVRQPLQSLTIKAGAMHEEFIGLIRDEVNVKEVQFNEGAVSEVSLDTNITPELKEEGDVREFMRAIQAMRKNAGLEPNDSIILTVKTGSESLLQTFQSDIQNTVGAEEIIFGDTDGAEIKANEHVFIVSLQKVV